MKRRAMGWECPLFGCLFSWMKCQSVVIKKRVCKTCQEGGPDRDIARTIPIDELLDRDVRCSNWKPTKPDLHTLESFNFFLFTSIGLPNDPAVTYAALHRLIWHDPPRRNCLFLLYWVAPTPRNFMVILWQIALGIESLSLGILEWENVGTDLVTTKR